MTVKELIEALQKLPEDTFVYSEMRGFTDTQYGPVQFTDTQYGPVHIQGCTSTLEYNEKEDLLHLVANFDIATTVSN